MYVWIKVLHVVAVISWIAGMLYLPRLFDATVFEKDQTRRSPV
jgi:uncharacterized membrane protein